jgi:hypothetical protein
MLSQLEPGSQITAITIGDRTIEIDPPVVIGDEGARHE